jgi:glycosyltransferase involved in cell wall biosynthesis
MNIGFDAKRAYHNQTGLGYYSRTLISLLSKYYPGHQYFLFNPKPSRLFAFNQPNIHEIRPRVFFHKVFPSAWRSSWVTGDLQKQQIDLYHGLSHEIPVGIQKTGIPSVVTIHDLIHERHPEQYNPIDVKIYSRKFRYACQHADKIIAISNQTKADIIEFYKIPADKIAITWQSCDPAFAVRIDDTEKEDIKKAYGLPAEFFLHVGSIIERKNLLNMCKAQLLLKDELNIPLVVIGSGGKYKQQVKDFIKEQGLEQRIIFLSENKNYTGDPASRKPSTLAAIYQSAIALIYPSFYEGFGAPVLEALWSRLPVITSNVSCLPEVAGDAAFYVDPAQPEEIAAGMKKIYSDSGFAATMKEKGWQYAQRSSPEKYAAAVMDIYLSLAGKR